MQPVPTFLLLAVVFLSSGTRPPVMAGTADEIIIRFHPASTWAERDKLLSHYGIMAVSPAPDTFLVHGIITSSYTSAALSSLLVRHPVVTYSEPNYRYRLAAIPNDPYFKDQWGLHNVQYRQARFNADIDAPEAWQRQKGSRAIIIGIIDSGADYDHEGSGAEHLDQ